MSKALKTSLHSVQYSGQLFRVTPDRKVFGRQLSILTVCPRFMNRHNHSSVSEDGTCMQLPRLPQRLASITVAAFLSVISCVANAQSSQQQNQSAPQGKQAPANQEEEQAKALAKAVQNPVASLISVPLQNNTNFDIGPNDRTQNILNIQPVIPVRVSKNWNLIMRIVTPVIYQPSIASLVIPVNTPLNHLGTLGLGDMNPTFFLSPAKPKKLIWGVGPAFLLPTATDNVLGQGKWSIGPSVVGLVQPGHWTIGILINNVWSFAGSGRTLPFPEQLLPCGACTGPLARATRKT